MMTNDKATAVVLIRNCMQKRAHEEITNKIKLIMKTLQFKILPIS